MRATGEQPGEQMMDTSNEPTGPTIDENLVNQLVEMGYPYHASRKALYHTSQQLEVTRDIARVILMMILGSTRMVNDTCR